ncbi:MAG TPA: 3'(2'),5'-bisphosphate nucleotidase CysQ [Trebonia sp.]
MSIPDDHALAADLAERAGRLLLDLRARGGDPGSLRDAGDRQSHEFLMAELAQARPGDAVLSEEGIDDKARLAADRVWIVDPLDGTREFGEPGRTDWAVHVALWARDPSAARGQWPAVGTAFSAPGQLDSGQLIAGAVALPAQGRVLATEASPGAGHPYLANADEGAERPNRWGGSGRPPEGGSAEAVPGLGAERPIRMVVSRSRASELVKDVAARINAELVPCGSAGAKVATVVLGENDVYLHSGGFYEWDTAAPVAVAAQCGLHVSRIDGSPVAYNREDPLLPDILVCRSAIANLLLDAIREAKHAI